MPVTLKSYVQAKISTWNIVNFRDVKRWRSQHEDKVTRLEEMTPYVLSKALKKPYDFEYRDDGTGLRLKCWSVNHDSLTFLIFSDKVRSEIEVVVEDVDYVKKSQAKITEFLDGLFEKISTLSKGVN